MLTGSAAQPRSGTAPKAPAASAEPAAFRNLRRLCRFDRVRLATSPFLDASSARSLVMPSPLIAVQPRRIAPARPPVCSERMLARVKIVYNIVFNTIIVEVSPVLGQAPVPAVLRWDLMAAKLFKGVKVRQSRETARVPARAPAAAARAAGRAGSLRPLSHPSRRCAARAVRVGEEGSRGTDSEPRRDGPRTDAVGGEGDLRGARGSRGDGGAHHPVSGFDSRYRAARGAAAPAREGDRKLRDADRILQQSALPPGAVRPLRQCLPDRDHRFACAEGLWHPLLRQCFSRTARSGAARPSRHDQGIARLAARGIDRADKAAFETLAAGLYAGL